MGLDGLCGNSVILKLVSLLKLFVSILQILAPIIVIILVSVSFYHVIMNSEKGLDKVKTRLKNGIIGLLIIYLVPSAFNGVLTNLTGDSKILACYFEADTEVGNLDDFLDDEFTFEGPMVIVGKVDLSKKSENNGNNGNKNNESSEVTIGNTTVTGDTAKLIAVAKQEWLKIVHGNFHYSSSHSDKIPLSGHSVDCSSYVSDVLYHFGYKDFAGKQHRTKNFMATNWNKKYGWTEISIKGGENVTSKLKPGDIFVRTNVSKSGSVGYGHVTFIVAIENGKVYAYDCGASSHWRKESPITLGKFLKDKRPGKIIRVT